VTKKNTNNELKDRIRICADIAGSGDALAKSTGIPRRTLESYLSGNAEPKASRLEAIVRAVGVSGHWLLTGEGQILQEQVLREKWGSLVYRFLAYYASREDGWDDEETVRRFVADYNAEPPRVKRVAGIPVITSEEVNHWFYEVGPDSDEDQNNTQDILDENYALLPLYNVRAAAGHGTVVEAEQVVDWIAFKREWLERELHANKSDLYLIEVDGESMEPTLRPGDIILVDHRAANTVPRDGIYVLRIDDALLVKRLQRLPGGKIHVTSDNEAYKPFEIDLKKENDIAIIGRVIWAGRRL